MDRRVLALKVKPLREWERAHGAVMPTRRPLAERRIAALPRPGQPQVAVTLSTSCESVGQILRDLLRSAAEVLDAKQAFFLIARDEHTLEAAATRNIRPAEVMDLILSQAAHPVHVALFDHQLAAADGDGHALPIYDGYFETNTPATLCVPMDLGLRQTGALCVVRHKGARRLSDLDLEIAQALTEQAAVVIAAARHQSALSHLEASLSDLAPAAS